MKETSNLQLPQWENSDKFNFSHVNDAFLKLDNGFGNAVSNILNQVYPVGSIYMSVNNTNPSILFGGTWVRIAEGRTLIGVQTGDAYFRNPEATGGKKESSLLYHNHSFTGNNASCTVSTDTHSHYHAVTGKHVLKNSNEVTRYTTAKYVKDGTASGYTKWENVFHSDGKMDRSAFNTDSTSLSHSHTATVTPSGTIGYAGTQMQMDYSNIPPYYTCYIWKRTAL